MTKDKFMGVLVESLESFKRFIEKEGIEIDAVKIDHIGYKCSSADEYEEIR